jgi:hypothetical protein
VKRFELSTLMEYTDEALLSELHRIAGLHKGATLTVKTFDSHGSRVHSSTLRKRFGSWRAALSAAGLLERFDDSNKAISKQDVLAELRKVSRLLATSELTVAEFAMHASFGPAPVRRAFGSFRSALHAADLQASPLGRRYSAEECFENILALWTHYGRQPRFGELSIPPSTVGPKAYVARWGGWRGALAAFVEQANTPAPTTLEHAQEDGRNCFLEPSNLRAGLTATLTVGLRYRVLKRDHFRCTLCGRSPATTVGAELHVDHIVPRVRGGDNSLGNLRALCSQCNLGKSASIEGDV